MSSTEALLEAAARGDCAAVARFLEDGVSVNAANEVGSTGLHRAALGGHRTVAEQMLGARASIDARAENADTPLMLAAYKGQSGIVNALLRARASVDLPNEGGWTPLMFAARDGRSGIVDALLAARASVDAQHQYGWTSLHRAAQSGHRAGVEQLLGAGASIDAVTWGGDTPLMLAAYTGESEVLDALLRARASVEVQNQAGKTAVDLARADEIRALLQEAAEERARAAAAAAEAAAATASAAPAAALAGAGGLGEPEAAAAAAAAAAAPAGGLGVPGERHGRSGLTADEVAHVEYRPLANYVDNPPPNPQTAMQHAEECIDILPRVPQFKHVLLGECSRVVESKLGGTLATLIAEYNICEKMTFAIAFYTMEVTRVQLGTSREDNFYYQFNEMLRERSGTKLDISHGYIYLLMTGLDRLPPYTDPSPDAEKTVLYRGIDRQGVDLARRNYTLGARIHWSAFSSASVDINVALSFADTDGIVLKITLLGDRSKRRARDVRPFSPYSNVEQEILLLPNFKCSVHRALYWDEDLQQNCIDLQESESGITIY